MIGLMGNKKSTVALKRRRRQLQRLLFKSSEGNNDKISNCTLHKYDQIDELNQNHSCTENNNENTKIIILYCTKDKTGKQMSQITIALKKTLRLQVTKITIASSLTNCFCNNCSMSGGSGFSPKVALLLLCFTLTAFVSFLFYFCC